MKADLRPPRLFVRSIERASFDEVFITVVGSPRGVALEGAEAIFGALAETAAKLELQPMGEKIYGSLAARDELLARRAAAAPLAPPSTFIEGRCVGDEEGAVLAGVQLWGIVPKSASAPRLTVLDSKKENPGCLIEGDGFRWLYLAAVDGVESDPSSIGATAQASAMFARADVLLRQRNFRYDQVARTWIYSKRLLDWYIELNAVRTEHHRRVGLSEDQQGQILPASTGIQGAAVAPRECVMDVLATDGGATPIRRSLRQGRAFAYGSSFSRGMRIEAEGQSTIYVSGTASIDAEGESSYRGDAEAQSLATLLAISDLLSDHGAGLGEICSATIFCKTPAVYQAYEDVCRLLGIVALPAIVVIADVCRPELLIEIEAVAKRDG